MVDLPSYAWLLIMTGVIAIPATTCVNLYRGAVATTGERAKARVVTASAACAFYGWVVVSGLLAWVGAYRQDIPWMGIAAMGAFIAILLATRIPLISRILAEPTMAARIVEPQVFRTVGSFFLIVLALGKLPALFAWTAAFGDIAVGLATPFIANLLRHRPGARAAIVYNLIGLLDGVAGFTIAYLTGSGSGGLLPTVPSSSDTLDVLPLALIPTTVVPLTAALSIMSLTRLRLHGRLALERGPLSAHPDPVTT